MREKYIQDMWGLSGRKGKGKRWRLRIQGLPGHDRPVVELFDDLGEAKGRRNELVAAKGRPMDRIDAGTVRLSQIAAAYLKALRADEHPPTDHYLDAVEHILARAVVAGLDDVRHPLWARNVQAWLKGLTACRNGQVTAKPASVATKRQYRAVLGGAINFAIGDLRALRDSPFRGTAPRRTKSRRIAQAKASGVAAHQIIPLPVLRALVADDARRWRDPEREAVEQLLAANPDKQAAADALGVHLSTIYNRLNQPVREDPRWLLVAILAYTGMRFGQAYALEWRDLDLDQRTVCLRAEVVGNRSGHETVVELEDELVEILTAIPKEQRAGLVVPDPVSAAGRPMRRAWLRESLGDYLAERGAAGHTAHDFRHSFVALLTAMGIPTADVRRRVNHSDISMTARYADHLLAGYRKECRGWGGVLRMRP